MKNAPSKPKVVIDTNVFISALVFGGKPRQVTKFIADKTIILVTSEECLSELRRKVIAKFPEFINELAQLERLLSRRSIMVKLGFPYVSVSRDPDHDKLIETAYIGKCQYLVSGDKDLLSIKSYKGISIITAAEFLVIMNKD